jgi:hypothetical protein
VTVAPIIPPNASLPVPPAGPGDLVPWARGVTKAIGDLYSLLARRADSVVTHGLASELPAPQGSRRLFIATDTGEGHYDAGVDVVLGHRMGIYATDYGVRADGVTDDAANFVAGAAAALAAGKPYILPAGVIRLATDIVWPDLPTPDEVHVVVQGQGAPRLCANEGSGTPGTGGTIIRCEGTGGVAITIKPTNAFMTVSLRDLEIQGPDTDFTTTSGDGLHLDGSVKYIRATAENLSIHHFFGGIGLYMNNANQGTMTNVSTNFNKYGTKLVNSVNAETWLNFVAEHNSTNGLIIGGPAAEFPILDLLFVGGLIQSNPKNGVLISHASDVTFLGTYFEANNTAAGGPYYAVDVHGTVAEGGVSRVNFIGCYGSSSTDTVRILGDTSPSGVSFVSFFGTRLNAATSVYISGFAFGTVFGTFPGGAISDTGIGSTVYLQSPTASPAGYYGPWFQADTLRLGIARTPASRTAAGNPGEMAWDANHRYLCTAANVWTRQPHEWAGYGGTPLALVNGGNNDVALQPGSEQVISGPTAAFTITGIAGGYNGRRITIVNWANVAMTLAHNSASSLDANRIWTPGGADLTLTGYYHALTLEYGASNKWYVVGAA